MRNASAATGRTGTQASGRRGPGDRMTARVAAALRTERAGLDRYDRARALPRLIALDPRGLRDASADAGRIVARLQNALQAERRRGASGHPAYDLNRHLALMQALAAEKRSL